MARVLKGIHPESKVHATSNHTYIQLMCLNYHAKSVDIHGSLHYITNIHTIERLQYTVYILFSVFHDLDVNGASVARARGLLIVKKL